MESLKIVFGCIVAAVLYGVIHDQFTVRICVEYFSVFHPRVFATNAPTFLALGWGIIATWWVGAILGVLLALAARAGSRPKLNAVDLVGPVAKLLGLMAACAVVSGVVGFVLTQRQVIFPPELVRYELAPFLHARFMADWWAHNTSYGVGLVGGVLLCGLQYRKRCARSGERE
jgi:hypothetical protein